MTQIKNNEATRNRPQGERILDAPYVISDIAKRIKQLKYEDSWHKNDRNAITIFKTDELTIVLICVRQKAIISDNVINGIITIQVLDGKIKISSDLNAIEVKKQQLFVLHKNIHHSIEAMKDSVILLTNYTL